VIYLVGEFLPLSDIKQLRLVCKTFDEGSRRRLPAISKVVITDNLSIKEEYETLANLNPDQKRVVDFITDFKPLQKQSPLRHVALKGPALFGMASLRRLSPFLREFGNNIRELSCEINWEDGPVTNLINSVTQMENLTQLKMVIKFPPKWKPLKLLKLVASHKSNNISKVFIDFNPFLGTRIWFSYSHSDIRLSVYQSLVDVVFESFPNLKVIQYNTPKDP